MDLCIWARLKIQGMYFADLLKDFNTLSMKVEVYIYIYIHTNIYTYNNNIIKDGDYFCYSEFHAVMRSLDIFAVAYRKFSNVLKTFHVDFSDKLSESTRAAALSNYCIVCASIVYGDHSAAN